MTFEEHKGRYPTAMAQSIKWMVGTAALDAVEEQRARDWRAAQRAAFEQCIAKCEEVERDALTDGPSVGADRCISAILLLEPE